jgi:hypothetical protein
MKKQEFVYPGSDLDRSRNLIALLGSFWARNYAGIDQIHSYVDAVGETVTQSYRNLLEVVAALSRFDVPLFHEELLVPVTLKKRELNTTVTSLSLFDRGATTIDGTLVFDRPLQDEFFAFPLPDNLVDVAHFFSRIAFPGAALAKNIDFIIDTERKAIIFAANPFENPAFSKRLYESVDGTDEEITLWGFCGRYDYNYVFEQFAYAVSLQLKTSQGAKDLMNAITTGLLDAGASVKTLDAALTAICGIPVTVDPRETVEVVRYDNHGLFIATDKNVYRFSYRAEPLVVIGQSLLAGSYLVRGFDVSEFYTGNNYIPVDNTQQIICQSVNATILETTENADLTTESDDDIVLNLESQTCRRVRQDIAALALDSGFLSACFYGDLVFENRDIPLEIDTNHPSGFTYVKFGLGGLPADVEHFFNELHHRGMQYALQPPDLCHPRRRQGTLAQILDRRAQPDTQPTTDHLPRTINPLKFLVENVLRNNVFVVRIFIPALGQNHLGLYNIRHLRQLIPPQTAMIVVFELVVDLDTIKAEDRITGNVTTFTGMNPLKDTVPVTLLRDIGATAHLISGTCQ